MAATNRKALAESMAAAKRAIDERREPNRATVARSPKAEPVIEVHPTDEQKDRGHFYFDDVIDKLPGGTAVKIGKAYRRRPMFEVLGDQNVLTDAEVKALRHYRHHADIADRSPLRDSLNKQRGGSGMGPTVEMVSAIRVRDDCERAAGSLVDILRAVVIYDVSLSQWAIGRSGGTEITRKGRSKASVEPREAALNLAKREIRFAAQRVEADIDARRR